ncbi:LacI family DNA-binding transcriptional regulator [Enterococcus sp. BWR-S5]|uniref:LacI family DNA-binding transcriptional regulator n=1 Tax=Enterococcus sp. BWR-S5 TaxID=2787714 RepID=UPI001922B7AD|nr:LacI family DNA-binding transcriptional regulator [Enterococcus sp. BWR-S5]MBL1226033.1 LacI family DNA-binding transcriptional regulator [Enterococcus sp. BWR-S5]
MKENITISDVAAKAGVSKATISRYLNGKYNHMSEKTKKKIEQVIAELEYRPSKQAQQLKSKRSSLIGIIVADIENLYSSYLIKAVQEVCLEKGYQMIIMSTDNSPEEEQRALVQLLDQNVEGILLQPVATQLESFSILSEAGIPVVLLDRSLNTFKWTTVRSNNYGITKQLGELIAEKGYEKIVHVTEPLDNLSVRLERYEAMKHKSMEHNMEIELIEIRKNEQQVASYLESHSLDKKTAFFAANGNALYEVIATLQNAGIQFPKECGVCGYDDWFWAELITPGITTIHQDPFKIGKRSAEILYEIIAGELIEEQIEIPSQLHIRGSL